MPTEHFDVGHLLPGGGEDIQMTFTASSGCGKILFLRDRYLGTQYYKLCQNRSGSVMAYGELASLHGGVSGITSITNLDSGTTTSATKAAGFTANVHEGALGWVFDKNAVAGAAPECEMVGILRNTAAIASFDPRFPLSVALAVNDDLDIQSTFQIRDAAQNDTTQAVQGVIAATTGIPNNECGWVQFFGRCRALTVSAAYAPEAMLVAGAARLAAPQATDTGRVYVGKNLLDIKADSASDFALVFINCGDNAFGNIGTLDLTT